MPVWPPLQHVPATAPVEMGLAVYPPVANGGCSFVLYEDDGVSFRYEEDAVAETGILCRRSGETVKVVIQPRVGHYESMPEQRCWTLNIRLSGAPSAVMLNKAPAVHSNDATTRMLSLSTAEQAGRQEPVIIYITL